MAEYEVWLKRDDGTAIQLLQDWESLQYSIVANDVGVCTLVLPAVNYDPSLFVRDRRLEIFRSPTRDTEARLPKLMENIYFIRSRKEWADKAGIDRITLIGHDGNDLIRRRIIAYYANNEYNASPKAAESNQADDAMKVVARENLSTAAYSLTASTTERQLSTGYFWVAPDLALAPEINHAFAWRQLVPLLQEFGEEARTLGTATYFAVVPVETSPGIYQLEFRTWINQPGIDHTFPNGNGVVIVSREFGNLEEPSVESDAREEVNYVYVGGEGESMSRQVVQRQDASRIGASLFNRCEAFVDARDVKSSDINILNSRGDARLAMGRPKGKFAARIKDTPNSRYGLHWRWGDRVSAVYRGRQYDCLVRTITVTVDKQGYENIDTRLEWTS